MVRSTRPHIIKIMDGWLTNVVKQTLYNSEIQNQAVVETSTPKTLYFTKHLLSTSHLCFFFPLRKQVNTQSDKSQGGDSQTHMHITGDPRRKHKGSLHCHTVMETPQYRWYFRNQPGICNFPLGQICKQLELEVAAAARAEDKQDGLKQTLRQNCEG